MCGSKANFLNRVSMSIPGSALGIAVGIAWVKRGLLRACEFLEQSLDRIAFCIDVLEYVIDYVLST